MKRAGFVFLALVFGLGCSPGDNTPIDDGGSDGGDGSASCNEAGLFDSDGDGISDDDEGDESIDTDGDGTPDFRDTDSDDDGWLDEQESGINDCQGPPRDADGDEVPDYRDTDSDDNGILDEDESDEDLDGDGAPNWRDVDDDGDGIWDAVEIGEDPTDPADTDLDGVSDYHDLDSDGDTIPDFYDGEEDTDLDGLENFRDTDSDEDGWTDEEEYGAPLGDEPVDTDGDGAPDYRDEDSDDDRLSDADERVYGTSRIHRDTDDDGYTDLQEVQAGTDPTDHRSFPMPDPCNPSECLPAELCGERGNGDGIDNDCDGHVDDICPCTPGETRPCFIGTPSQRGEGVCSDGLLSCDEFGTWSQCTGGVFPTEEVCDGSDNDCDGLFDEELEDCESPLTCPGTRSGAPLSTIDLDGSAIYDGEFDSWNWEVFCPPTVDTCPLPADAGAQDTTVYLISSGAYRMRATITVGEDVYTCEYAVQVQGDGLRVELTWDSQGSANGDTDVDLHLHRPGTTSEWCSADDCYFSNCKSGGSIDWGYEPTMDTSACNEAPHGHGEEWERLGYCRNPRLDVDIITCDSNETDSTAGNFCSPENINVDNPELGDIFRVMVNYWGDHGFSGDTHPTINIYCGGALRATFGEGEVALTYSGGCGGDNWLVADVEFFVDECGGVDCDVRPILDFDGPDGVPWIQRGTDFGPDY